MTDQARPPVRQTIDVDLVAEVTSLLEYHSLRPKLIAAEFKEDSSAEHICRWRKDKLIVDVMPMTDVMGHSVNRWYEPAMNTAWTARLPNGEAMKVISAPLFIATKLEAFNDRGNGDYLHHDMEDILNIVDGREELPNEINDAPTDVQEFVRNEIDECLADENFVNQLTWMFPMGRSEVVIQRLRKIAGL